MNFTDEEIGLNHRLARKIVRHVRQLENPYLEGAPVRIDFYSKKAREAGLRIDTLKPLIQNGFVERIIGRPTRYKLTDSGVRLSLTTALKRMTRKQIDELYASVCEKAAEVQESDDFLYGFCCLAVYGSFLRDQPDYGDIDLVFMVRLKEKFKHLQHAELTRHHLKVFPADSTVMVPYLAAGSRALMHVKARRQRVACHDITDFVAMIQNNPIDLRHRDIIGCLEEQLRSMGIAEIPAAKADDRTKRGS